MNMDELLDKHAPYRKLNKYKLKTKPWITLAIKQEVHLKYKYYRNLLSTILKKSKQSYCEKFFQNNLNDIRPKLNS